jgi:hypothetical protein
MIDALEQVERQPPEDLFWVNPLGKFVVEASISRFC